MSRRLRKFHPTGSPRLHCAGTIYGNPRRGVCVSACACVERMRRKKKKTFLCWVEDENVRSRFRSARLTEQCGICNSKRFLFFFFRLHAKTRKEIPGYPRFQAARDPV